MRAASPLTRSGRGAVRLRAVRLRIGAWVLAFALGALAVSDEQDASQLLGAGGARYAWVSSWAQMPDGSPELPGNTHGGVAFDSRGRVYVNTDTEQSILVFEPDGSFVRAFGEAFAGGLHGMLFARRPATSGGETLILAHTQRGVLEVTLEGEVLWELGAPLEAGVYDEHTPWRPTGVALGPNGHLYVADGYGQSRVLEFDGAQQYVRTIGAPGSGPGEFKTPHGLCIDTRGDEPLLLIADRENGRLQSFTLDGEHRAVIAAELLRRPCSVAILGDQLVVADLNGRVTILDRENELVTHLGDNPDRNQWAQNDVPREAWREGLFLAPHHAAWDAAGDLYVVDWNRHGRVSKLTRVD